jgi:hypothetical protein
MNFSFLFPTFFLAFCIPFPIFSPYQTCDTMTTRNALLLCTSDCTELSSVSRNTRIISSVAQSHTCTSCQTFGHILYSHDCYRHFCVIVSSTLPLLTFTEDLQARNDDLLYTVFTQHTKLPAELLSTFIRIYQ